MYNHRQDKSLIEIELNRLRSVMLYDSSLQKQQPEPRLQPEVCSPPELPAKPMPQPEKPASSPLNQSMAQPQPHPEPQPQPLTQPQQEPQPLTQPQDNPFRPSFNQDSLFWCLYVMKNGTFKYEQITNKFTAEQDGKRDQVMLLREHAKQLKQSTGIKFTASTIECDIMSQRISLHALQVLVYLNSLNAVFVNSANQVYSEFISDSVSDKPVYIISRSTQNPKQLTMIQATESHLALVRSSHYRIENPQKPIKSVSAYTLAELTEMCHKLKIQLKPKMKKQELYDMVVKQLVL